MNGIDLAINNLQMLECQSSFESVTIKNSAQDLEKSLAEKFTGESAVVVIWQIQNVIFGRFDGDLTLSGGAEINPNHWLELRIFNRSSELHLKRKGNQLRGRYVEDFIGDGNFYVDSFSRFFGEEISSANGYIKLSDNKRKLSLEIPCDITGATWYGLLTRNYVKSDATGLSGYFDYRFVAIEPAKGGDEIG